MADLTPELLGPLPDPDVPLVPVDNELESPEYDEPDEQGTEGDEFAPIEADLDGDPIPEDAARAVSRGTTSRTAGRVPAGAIVLLRNLGWRIRTTNEAVQAVEHFQAAVNLGVALKVDGVVGPKTLGELNKCEMRRKSGLPTASAHFSFTEFRCKCGGRYSACARIWIKRAQIRDMESYRKALGRGISIVSGCRCLGHNTAVKGATHSRHMLGDASDFAALHPPSWFRSRNLFNGLGYNHSNNLVRHGDQGGVRSWIYA